MYLLFIPALYEKADIKAPEEKAAKHVIVGVTSDRGLCGAIHSGIAKTIKTEIANLTSAGKEVKVINVGDKLRGLLHRYSQENHFIQPSVYLEKHFITQVASIALRFSMRRLFIPPHQNSRETHLVELQGGRPQATQLWRRLHHRHGAAQLWIRVRSGLHHFQ